MKIRKCELSIIAFALLILSGCSTRDMAADYVGVKEYTATVSDSIVVSCRSQEYVVLDQKAEDEDLGVWMGRADSFAGNVYVSSINAGTDDDVLAMVNGVYYHAKPKDALKYGDVTLNPSDVDAFPIIEVIKEGNVEILHIGATQYVLTEDTVDGACLGKMIAIADMSYEGKYKTYKEVYSLEGRTDAIAVEINGRNIVAKKEGEKIHEEDICNWGKY